MGTYGDEELKILGDLYGKGDNADVDVPVLKEEWEGFRFQMLQTYNQNSMQRSSKDAGSR